VHIRYPSMASIVEIFMKTVTAYHGTNQRFSTFSREHLGQNTNAVSATGFYFTSSFEEAGDYARLAVCNVISNQDENNCRIADLYMRAAALEENGKYDEASEVEQEAEDLAIKVMRAPPSDAMVLTANLSLGAPYELLNVGLISTGRVQDIIASALSQGYDAVVLRGIQDSPTGEHTSDHYIVCDPQRINVTERKAVPSVEPEQDEDTSCLMLGR
jgi:hypothetical protein